MKSVVLTVALLAVGSAQAQASPTRTVYKCVVGGKVAYSDDPCLDAKPIDVTPTRGMSGSKGADVRREEQREQLAEALKPITGMTPDEFATAKRRTRLAPADRDECYRLDSSLQAQADPVKLLAARKRYKSLGC